MAEVDELLDQLRVLIERVGQLVAQASEVPPAAPSGRPTRALPRFTWEQPEVFPGGAASGVVFRPKDPVTHKIVCRCLCMTPDPEYPGTRSGSGWEQFEERADCGTLNGINCSGAYGEGKLERCEKRSVEVGRERVQDDPLVVMG
jgi:hypothetical protein